MFFWDQEEDMYMVERTGEGEETLLTALSQEDETPVRKVLGDLREPLSGRGTSLCLHRALDRSPELFRQVLEHCTPVEFADSFYWREDDAQWEAWGRGFILLIAAAMDRPLHARLLLEHGYDCNSAGIGFDDWSFQWMRAGGQNTVQLYARRCAALGNQVRMADCARNRTLSISCATPLAAALLCGSLRTGEVLLECPGVWRAESSAVCRAAVMVLEGVGESQLSEERRTARLELMRQIFCPERESLPDRETFLRTYALQPASFVDFCTAQTLRLQLEGGLCGGEEARRMLELLGEECRMGEPVRDDARGGKLLLIRKFFPNLCREPWATGVFLGEILRRSRKEMPHRTLLRVWKQLCGRERDLTWAGSELWKLGREELRRFLEETGEGGTLLLDGDAVPSGYETDCLAELISKVRFRRRDGENVSNLVRLLLETEDLRLLREAAGRGVLAGEDPAALMEYLIKTPRISSHVRAVAMVYGGRGSGAEALPLQNWREPRRWAYWKNCFPMEKEDECQADLDAVLCKPLSPEECLWRMFRLQQYQNSGGLMRFHVGGSRYPTLRTDSLCGVACCAENGQAMELMMEHLPGELLKVVEASWDMHLYFRGTPLALAAALGRTEQVRLLLESGLEPDEAGRGDTSRVFVVFVMRSFMEKGVPVTPLLAAILFGQEETARLLLDAGAVCDFSRPAHLRVLRQGSAASLDLAARLPGVGFEKIPEQEVEALRFAVSRGGAAATFWACVEEKEW